MNFPGVKQRLVFLEVMRLLVFGQGLLVGRFKLVLFGVESRFVPVIKLGPLPTQNPSDLSQSVGRVLLLHNRPHLIAPQKVRGQRLLRVVGVCGFLCVSAEVMLQLIYLLHIDVAQHFVYYVVKHG